MDKLAEIMAWKQREIAPRLRPVRERELALLRDRPRAGPGFIEALTTAPHLAVIAEIKRRSPSAGAIAEGADAPEQARHYYNAGADALSVLTDEHYFGGHLRDLWEVAEFMALRDDPRPCLRKDFMLHPIQVVEAAEAGAGAILIIVRALDDDTIETLFEAATAAGLDSLFEVHSERELERAMTAGARLIGVNNRDLTRFTTDLATTEALVPLIPDGVAAVSESGIFGPEEARRAREAGADAILVGQALMEVGDEVDKLVAELQGA